MAAIEKPWTLKSDLERFLDPFTFHRTKRVGYINEKSECMVAEQIRSAIFEGSPHQTVLDKRTEQRNRKNDLLHVYVDRMRFQNKSTYRPDPFALQLINGYLSIACNKVIVSDKNSLFWKVSIGDFPLCVKNKVAA